MSTADTQKVQHSTLGFKDSATANGTHLNGRHRHRDLEVAIVADWKILISISKGQNVVMRTAYFFMVVIQLLLSTFWAGS